MWDSEQSGAWFGRYQLLERLGVGGMATVHRAKTRGVDGFEAVVAVKRILPHLAEDPSFVASFVREAKLASLLQHPNIVRIHELGRIDDDYFMAMEYVSGHTLLELLRWERVVGPPPNEVVLSLIGQLCDALDYAHTRTDPLGEPLGIVHRDLSPSNLIVERSGFLKVIDFGIAKATPPELRTESGMAKGKQGYMSPEALRARGVDARSDVFSAGVIAHELLTGKRLFTVKDDYQTLRRIMRTEIDPPSRHNPRCSPAFDALVLRALARDPDERWQSAGAMRDALDALALELGVRPTNRAVAVWVEQASAQRPVLMREPGSGPVVEDELPSIVVVPTPTPTEHTAEYAAAPGPDPTAPAPVTPAPRPPEQRPPTAPVLPLAPDPEPESYSYVAFETPAGRHVTMLDGPAAQGADLRAMLRSNTPLPRPPASWPEPGRVTPAQYTPQPLRDVQLTTGWRRRDTLPPDVTAGPPPRRRPRAAEAVSRAAPWWTVVVGALIVGGVAALGFYLAW